MDWGMSLRLNEMSNTANLRAFRHTHNILGYMAATALPYKFWAAVCARTYSQLSATKEVTSIKTFQHVSDQSP